MGIFINTLPTRVKLDPNVDVLTWIKELRAQQVAIRPFEHSALVDAMGASDVARGTPLFETLLVINDLHNDTRLKALGGSWLRRDFDWHDQTSFPCSLMGYGDPEIHFKLSYDRKLFDDAAMERVAAVTTEILEAIARDPSAKVGALPSVAKEDARRIARWKRHARADRRRRVRPSADRGAGRRVARPHGRRLPRSVDHVRRARRARRACARRLRAMGVSRGARVGIFVERSIEMVVGPPRDPQGRRGVRADGPELPERARRVDGRRNGRRPRS